MARQKRKTRYLNRWEAMSHTKGPWIVETLDGYITGRILVDPNYAMVGGQPIQIVGQSPVGVGVQRRDDARLIAASPVMFGALNEAEAALELALSRVTSQWPDATERVALRIVRAAIGSAVAPISESPR